MKIVKIFNENSKKKNTVKIAKYHLHGAPISG